MTIERSWIGASKTLEQAKEIDEDRAQRELANTHGDNALEKLKKEKKLETRFAQYRIVE
jgi:hypothetical protein